MNDDQQSQQQQQQQNAPVRTVEEYNRARQRISELQNRSPGAETPDGQELARLRGEVQRYESTQREQSSGSRK